MTVSGGQTGFRMGSVPKTLWAVEPNSLTFAGWLLWAPGAAEPDLEEENRVVEAALCTLRGKNELLNGSQETKSTPTKQDPEKTQTFLISNGKHSQGQRW